MVFSLCLFLVSLYLFQWDLHSFLIPHIDDLHQKCLSLLPSTEFPHIYDALVCGERLKSGSGLHQVFVTTGLLHIFVVSGIHLGSLHKVMSWIKIPFFLQVSLLAVYALATNLHPPVVRAWFSLCLAFINQRYVLNWNSTLFVWHVSLMVLLFFSPWYDSFSFLLSWSASLALALGKNKPILTKNLIVYCVMSPLLASISHPHPVSILVNTLFLPFFGLFFFPFTLCSVIIPPLTLIMDQAWTLFFYILYVIAGDLPLFKPEAHLSMQQGFFYLLCLHLLIVLRCFWVRYYQPLNMRIV